MTRPPSGRYGLAARVTSQGPLRFTFITRSHSAGSMSSNGLRVTPAYTAALLSTTSMLPLPKSAQLFARASVESTLVTSAWKAAASAPVSRTSLAVSSAPARFTSATATR